MGCKDRPPDGPLPLYLRREQAPALRRGCRGEHRSSASSRTDIGAGLYGAASREVTARVPLYLGCAKVALFDSRTGKKRRHPNCAHQLLPAFSRCRFQRHGNLPRPKKYATGIFFASLCSAGLFDSRTGKKRHTPNGVCLFLVTRRLVRAHSRTGCRHGPMESPPG